MGTNLIPLHKLIILLIYTESSTLEDQLSIKNACFIVLLNVSVAFEQKLKLYVGLVMLNVVCHCRCFENGLSSHFQTMLPVTKNP